MQINRSIIRKLTSGFLLVSFVFYFVGINFFPHKHVINGRVIVHSHPFSSNEHHSHSSNALNLIQQLSNLQMKNISFGASLILFFKILFVTQIKQIILVPAYSYKRKNFSRPPPFIF